MKEDNKNKINRRDFFKLAGAGTLASAAALYGCSGNKNNGESKSAALGDSTSSATCEASNAPNARVTPSAISAAFRCGRGAHAIRPSPPAAGRHG